MEQYQVVVKDRRGIICVRLVVSEDASGPSMNVDDWRVERSSLTLHSQPIWYL